MIRCMPTLWKRSAVVVVLFASFYILINIMSSTISPSTTRTESPTVTTIIGRSDRNQTERTQSVIQAPGTTGSQHGNMSNMEKWHNASVPRNMEKWHNVSVPGNMSNIEKWHNVSVPGNMSNIEKWHNVSVPGNMSNMEKWHNASVPGNMSNTEKWHNVSVPGNMSNMEKWHNASVPGNTSNMEKWHNDSVHGNTTRYLIYLCDKSRYCGGWADRQKGVVGAYMVSVVTGRRFGINMSYPCDIKYLYVPHQVDWFITTNHIKGLSWQIVDWIDNRNRNVEMYSDFNALYPSDVVFLRSNQDVVKRAIKSARYRDKVPAMFRVRNPWPVIWKHVMQPSLHFEENIDLFMARVPPGQLVCAHIRMRRNPSIPNDSRAINSMSSLNTLWEFLGKFETTHTVARVFIATDSVAVRESARTHFGGKELDTNGLILHVDRQGKNRDACWAFETALLEQVVLSRCNKLVLTASGFGVCANQMANITQEAYMFKNGTITRYKCNDC